MGSGNRPGQGASSRVQFQHHECLSASCKEVMTRSWLVLVLRFCTSLESQPSRIVDSCRASAGIGVYTKRIGPVWKPALQSLIVFGWEGFSLDGRPIGQGDAAMDEVTKVACIKSRKNLTHIILWKIYQIGGQAETKEGNVLRPCPLLRIHNLPRYCARSRPPSKPESETHSKGDKFDGINAEQLRMPNNNEISYFLFDLIQFLFPLVRTVVVRFKKWQWSAQGGWRERCRLPSAVYTSPSATTSVFSTQITSKKK